MPGNPRPFLPCFTVLFCPVSLPIPAPIHGTDHRRAPQPAVASVERQQRQIARNAGISATPEMPEMTAWQAKGDVIVDSKGGTNEDHRHWKSEGRHGEDDHDGRLGRSAQPQRNPGPPRGHGPAGQPVAGLRPNRPDRPPVPQLRQPGVATGRYACP